jgi:signal transduction histidine kinase
VTVRVWRDAAERIVVECTDDGRGGADMAKGTGLSGLAKRVAAIDGTLTVTSPEGGPTTVRAEIPCAS